MLWNWYYAGNTESGSKRYHKLLQFRPMHKYDAAIRTLIHVYTCMNMTFIYHTHSPSENAGLSNFRKVSEIWQASMGRREERWRFRIAKWLKCIQTENSKILHWLRGWRKMIWHPCSERCAPNHAHLITYLTEVWLLKPEVFMNVNGPEQRGPDHIYNSTILCLKDTSQPGVNWPLEAHKPIKTTQLPDPQCTQLLHSATLPT